MAAILKFFKRLLLPNHKSDWAETWWEVHVSERHRDSELLKSIHSVVQDGHHGGQLEILQTTFPPKWVGLNRNLMEISERHRDSELLKSFCWLSKMAAMAAILKFFKRHLTNHKLDWAETWWEASEWHRDSELLKSFNFPVQDDRLGDCLEKLKSTSAPESYVRLSPNLVGGIGVTCRIAKIIPFQYPRWQPMVILKIFKRHLLPNRKSDRAETWCEALVQYRDSESLKSFRSSIKDGGHGGYL